MNINHGAAQQAQQATYPLNQRFQSLTSEQIDEAVLEADKSWRDEGKRRAYSRHLANALVARLPGQPWISVDERLPKSTPGSDEVVFFSPDMRNPTDQAIGILRYGRWLSAGVEFVNVTHWKPRDQPPQRRSEDAAAIKRPEVHRLSKGELRAVERAADLLEHYAAFINKVKPDEIELHPYVPELEITAESLRELIAASAPFELHVGFSITEEMHVAACQVLTRSHGLDGLPQRMLDAMLTAQAKGRAA